MGSQICNYQIIKSEVDLFLLQHCWKNLKFHHMVGKHAIISLFRLPLTSVCGILQASHFNSPASALLVPMIDFFSCLYVEEYSSFETQYHFIQIFFETVILLTYPFKELDYYI